MPWTQHGHWMGPGVEPAEGRPDPVAKCTYSACPSCLRDILRTLAREPHLRWDETSGRVIDPTGPSTRPTLVITFPEIDVDAAVDHHKRLNAAAESLGRAGATWKVSEGWYCINLRTWGAADELQAEAVPLPRGWTMRIK
ncbi:hypothetical protein GCM10022254_09480 [Actinomadura meridiana]|uniref:Uncharacterized protein n=1 Tax=Actinomadura meridiana TaxID=559626 RepID=A0ABP8BTX0_9ACTN